MPQVITWTKQYAEDLGEQDEAGFFDYAYCYFSYSFCLPDGARLQARQYTHTRDECALYTGAYYSPQEASAKAPRRATYLAAILGFLRATQGITKFSYLSSEGYKELILNEPVESTAGISFLEDAGPG